MTYRGLPYWLSLALRGTLLTGMVFASLGCSPRVGLERLIMGDKVRRIQDLAYGAAARQQLDVYASRRAGGAAPVVVFLYGGRWKYGSKDDYLLIGNAFVRRGWVTVVPDYRLYPDVLFPAWVEDGATAVRWTVDNIERFGGDPRRIIVVGHSAGGHTAALLGLQEDYLRDAGVPPETVKGFVSIAGPVDTSWTAPDVQRLMGPREGWPRTYPATHVDGDAPPMYFMHGTSDDVVFAASSERLAERIHRSGGCARAKLYRGLGHIDIAVALGIPGLRVQPVLDDLARFVRNPEAATCPRA